MIQATLGWLAESSIPAPVLPVAVVLSVATLALIATQVSRFVTRRVIRRLANASLRSSRNHTGLWRARSTRVGGETGETGERRRRQRIDAASRMVNHLASLVIFVVATIVTFHVLDVNPAFFLSSAGFLGAGLAIGGQHKVNDYLTGLSVHFEDRYGLGDELLVYLGSDEPVGAVVDHIGLFSTRLRDDRSTVHLPNSALAHVRNLSQEAASSTIHLRVPDDAHPDEAASMLRELAGSDGLTDLIFVGDLAAREGDAGQVAVDVRTSRTIDDRERERLVGRAERAFGTDLVP